MTAQEFNELIQEAGFDTRSYSGRAMYGKECLAFTCEAWNEITATAKIVEAAPDDILNDVVSALKRSRTDSMGKGTIIYFPSIEYVE